VKHLKSLWSICLVAAALAAASSPSVSRAQDTTAPAPDAPAASSEAAPAEAASEEAAPAEADGEAQPAATTTATAQTAASGDAQAQGDAASTLSSPTGEGEAQEGGEAQPAHAEASEDESQAAEAQAAAEPLAWRNSFFSYSIASTFDTFCRGCYLSYNPNVYQFFSLTPRWYIDPSTFFFLSLGGFYEFTNDDSAAYNHEFQLTDLVVELRRTVPWEGFIFIPAARLTFPTSKASQGAQRYVNGALGVTVVRPIPEALGMTIAGVFRYQRWFAGSNVVLARGQCVTQGVDTELAGCDATAATESDRIVAGLNVNITPFEHFTVTLSAFWVWSHVFDLANADVPVLGGTFTPELAGGATRWRNFTSYSIGVAYDVVDWCNLSLTVSNATFLAPLYNDNGNLREPLRWDSQVSLAATFTLDAIYTALTTSGEPDDGLTPEERQRRRQGLASRDGDDDEQPASSTTGSRSSF
jgi:hypothetical protein